MATRTPHRFVTAYLIAVCDDKTNALKSASIWSSPEWEQSRCIPDCRTYVAYEVQGTSFGDARRRMIEVIADERCRYHYLSDLLDKT